MLFRSANSSAWRTAPLASGLQRASCCALRRSAATGARRRAKAASGVGPELTEGITQNHSNVLSMFSLVVIRKGFVVAGAKVSHPPPRHNANGPPQRDGPSFSIKHSRTQQRRKSGGVVVHYGTREFTHIGPGILQLVTLKVRITHPVNEVEDHSAQHVPDKELQDVPRHGRN